MLRVVQKLRLHRSSEEDIFKAATLLRRIRSLDATMFEEHGNTVSESNTVFSVCNLVVPAQMFVDGNMEALQCNVFLSQNHNFSPQFKNFGIRTFTTPELRYEPFCDDFGPMNMLSVVKFIATLEHEISGSRAQNVVYLVQPGARNLTNAAFLLGAYMILKLGQSPENVADAFSSLESRVEGFRDATYSSSAKTFRLRLIDCWRGLYQAKALHWIAMPSSENPTIWGEIDVAEYERYDDSLNGDLHVVVPGRFAAFRSPRSVDGRKYRDNYCGDVFFSRDFSPGYYSEIFKALDVTTVVRLNEPCYARTDFVDEGIEHFDLPFEDCSAPPADVVARFFHISDQADGLVAVHCRAGLGCTGTLIALSLIRSHGFSARAAMGWLRIMRPGSVIGDQQDFLCAVEACLLQRDGSLASPPSSPPLPSRRRSPSPSPVDGATTQRPRREARYFLPSLPSPPPLTRSCLAECGDPDGRAAHGAGLEADGDEVILF